MSYDDPPDDEDWYDDDDDALDEEEAARCPECGEPVHSVTDKCSACGYWFSDADRPAMWSGSAKPRWMKVVAAIVLVAFLTGLLAAGLAMF